MMCRNCGEREKMADPRTKLINTMRELCHKKDIDKISVSELVELAGVSRQTFYKYYQDKYELALALYMVDVYRRGDAAFQQNRSFKEMCRAILSAMKESPRLYQTLFRDKNAQNSFMVQWHEFSVEHDCNTIGRANVTPDLRIVLDAWITATDKVLSDWVLGGMKEDADYIIDIFIRLMPVEIRPYML